MTADRPDYEYTRDDRCHRDGDGHCSWMHCPQMVRPMAGRSCPLPHPDDPLPGFAESAPWPPDRCSVCWDGPDVHALWCPEVAR